LAVVRTERRLSRSEFVGASSDNSNFNASASGLIAPGSAADAFNALRQPNASPPSLSDLLISEEEEEATSVFCRQATAQLLRIRQGMDAASGLEQAGTAMQLLQASASESDLRASIEAKMRCGLEQALRSGCEMLSAACARRLSVDHLLDLTKRAVLSVSAS
jgi:hypothetical protein